MSICIECKSVLDAKYYKDNKEKILKRVKKWAIENREKRNEISRRYYARNKEHHLYLTKNRKARLMGADGSHTIGEWRALKTRHGNLCAICGKKEPFEQYRKYLTKDHIIPLSKGGTNYIKNIQPLCFSCNSAKKDRIKG